MTAIELILKHKANIIFILFIVLYIGSCYYSYNAGVNNGRVEQCNLMGGTLAWVHDVKEEPYIDCISDSKRNFYNEKNKIIRVNDYELSKIDLLNMTN